MDSTQKTVSDILKYGKDVGANMDIFIKLFATSSSDMYWFSTKETLDFNIKIWDIENNQFLKENSSQKIEYQEEETKIVFIKKYFRELKEIPYKQSWNKLNSSMKRDVSFTKYKKWWSKSVESIQILDTQSLRDNKVKIKLLYMMTNGKKICSLDTFTLKKEGNGWFIAKQSYRGCSH